MLIKILISSLPLLGQTVFKVDKDAYRHNEYERKFVINEDSTSYLRSKSGNHYSLFVGKLKKVNDTLHEFTYRPVVKIHVRKRFRPKLDSVRFEVIQIDTVVLPKTLEINLEKSELKVIDLAQERYRVYLENVGKSEFSFDLSIESSLLQENVTITVGPMSDPVLSYYGVGVAEQKVQVLITGNALAVLPDDVHIYDKETFIRSK